MCFGLFLIGIFYLKEVLDIFKFGSFLFKKFCRILLCLFLGLINDGLFLICLMILFWYLFNLKK